MEQYYNGGYFLIKTIPIDYWGEEKKVIISCSSCFNIHAFDHWCTSWTSTKDNCHEKIDLELSDEVYEEIQQWNDKRFRSGSNVLPDLKTALEFKNLFFKSRDDIQIYSIYFSETDADL